MSADLVNGIFSSLASGGMGGGLAGSLHVGRQNEVPLAEALLGRLRDGGVCTQLVTGNRDWDCRSPLYEAMRSAARAGRKVEKTFLVVEPSLVELPALQEHRQLDAAAGIGTRIVHIGDAVPALAEAAPAGGLEFGLWDDSVCCSSVYVADGNGGRLDGWSVSGREEQLRRARAFFRDLDAAGRPLDEPAPKAATASCPAEPVVLSAIFADHTAQRYCRRDPTSGKTCAWYHGVWQYLRVLDIVTAPTDHADFFFETLHRLAAGGGYKRVLISGQADYSTLARVLRAYGEAGTVPAVTVVDICESPLHLGQWYARRASATIATHLSDILDFDGGGAFDVVCTHSFLGNFPPAARARLMASWHRALRPGGKVVTINRIRSPDTPDVVRFTASQAEAFRDRARREAASWRDILGVDPDELAQRVMTYATSKVTYPVRSRDEIAALFEDGGFIIERLESGPVAGRAESGPAGPTAPGNAEYARIVATRS